MSNHAELADIIAAANYRAGGPRMFRDEHAAHQILEAGYRKMPTVEQLSEFLFTIYDHGTKPNALAEAGAILAFMSIIRGSVPTEPSSQFAEGAKFAAAHLATKMPTVEQIAEELKRHHFSGTECRTNGPGGCVQCFGPSPMSAEEIARVVRDLIAGADVTPAGPCPCACHEWPGGGNAHPHTKCRCHGGEGMSL